MQLTEKIKHQGIIKKINPDTIIVNIKTTSACETCSIKNSCSILVTKQKDIEINNSSPGLFKIGEEVNVILETRLAYKAVLIAYIFPFLIIFFMLIILFLSTKKELLSGIISLCILIPYFAILRRYKNKLQKTFSLKLEKI